MSYNLGHTPLTKSASRLRENRGNTATGFLLLGILLGSKEIKSDGPKNHSARPKISIHFERDCGHTSCTRTTRPWTGHGLCASGTEFGVWAHTFHPPKIGWCRNVKPFDTNT